MDVSAQLISALNLLTQIVQKLEVSQGLPEQYKQKQDQYNKGTGYDNSMPPTLSVNEESRAKSTAAIFKQVFGVDQLISQETDTVRSRREAQQRNNIINVRVVDVVSSVVKKVTPNITTNAVTKEKKESSFFSTLLKGVGFGLIAVGVYQLIKNLQGANNINIKAIAGVAAVIGVLILAVKMAGNNKASSVIGLGVIAGLFAAVNFLLVPSLKDLAQLNTEQMITAVAGITGAVGGLLGLAYLAGKSNKVQLIAGLLGVAGIGFILNSLIVPSLIQLSSVDWKTMAANTAVAIGAITGFGVLVGVVGALVSTGVGALIAGAGLATIALTAKVMGYTAEQLSLWNGIDGNKLIQQAKGVTALNLALVTGIASAGAGILTNILNFFAEDPVEKYKNFERLDGVKLKVIGDAIKAISSSFVTVDPNNAKILAKSVEITATAMQKAYALFKDNNVQQYIDLFAGSLTHVGAILSNFKIKNDSVLVLDRLFTNFNKLPNAATTDTIAKYIDSVQTSIQTSINSFASIKFDAMTNTLSQLDKMLNIDKFAAQQSSINRNVVIDYTSNINTAVDSIKTKTFDIVYNVKTEFDAVLIDINRQEIRLQERQIELMQVNNEKLDQIIRNIRVANVSNTAAPTRQQFQVENNFRTNESTTKQEYIKSFDMLTSNIGL